MTLIFGKGAPSENDAPFCVSSIRNYTRSNRSSPFTVFLEEMAEQLAEKKTLSYKDIALIREKYLPDMKQTG